MIKSIAVAMSAIALVAMPAVASAETAQGAKPVAKKLGASKGKRSAAGMTDANNAAPGSLIAPILAAGVVVGGIVAVANDDDGGTDDSAS